MIHCENLFPIINNTILQIAENELPANVLTVMIQIKFMTVGTEHTWIAEVLQQPVLEDAGGLDCQMPLLLPDSRHGPGFKPVKIMQEKNQVLSFLTYPVPCWTLS